MTKNQQNMVLLDRDAILAASDMVYEVVDVPEWGGKVRVRGLTAQERDDWEGSMLQGSGKNRQVTVKNIRAKLVVRCIVDDKDNRVFTDDDVFRLGAKGAAPIDRVYQVASKLSKISEEDVDELAKNSGTDLSDSSS